MSETVRVFTEINKIRRYQRRNRYKRLLYITLTIIILLLLWGGYVSRDSYPAEQFIPQQSQLQIFSTQLMQNHQTLAQTPLWRWVPANSSLQEVRRWLQNEQPIPVWILRHLIYDFFSLSVMDFNHPDQFIAIIRLSRVGCLLESLFSATQPITHDWAGGLNLCYIPEHNLYYCRKGRILLVSSDRTLLIRCLTQPSMDYTLSNPLLHPTQKQEKRLAWGKADIPWKDLAEIVNTVHFSIALVRAQIGIRLEGEIIPNPDKPWTLLLTELTSGNLPEPPNADIAISLNTGSPLSVWLNTLESPALYLQPITPDPVHPPSLSFTEWLRYILGLFNNEIHFAINGFYTDEIVPIIPKFALIGNTNKTISEEEFRSLGNFAIVLLGAQNKPLLSSTPFQMIIPLLGSGQTDLILSYSMNNIVLTNNTEFRDNVTQFLSNTTLIESDCSISLKLKPYDFAQHLEQALQELTQSKIIHKENSALFEYLEKLKILKDVKIRLGLKQGKFKLVILGEFNTE